MFEAFSAALIVALCSLVGILIFGRTGEMRGTHTFILPAAIGVLLAVVLFELIPEALHEAGTLGSVAIASGFLGFYLLSHLLRTYHHHHTRECVECGDRSSAHLVLAGDAIHNIADGIVIASAFLINPAVGIAATVGIALHEIPQEIAEFSILLHAGYTKTQAALRNLFSASSIVLGVLAAFLLIEYAEGWLGILIGVAAGNLLYIAATDLLPELHRDHASQGHFWQVFPSVLAGLVIMAGLLTYTHTHVEVEEHGPALEVEAEHDTH